MLLVDEIKGKDFASLMAKRDIEATMNRIKSIVPIADQMRLAFEPLIIACIAWHYTDVLHAESVRVKRSQLIPLNRAIKKLKQEFEDYVYQDVRRKDFEKVLSESMRFMDYHSSDFTILLLSIRNEFLAKYPDINDVDIRVAACAVQVLIDVLEEHNAEINRTICKKYRLTPTITLPVMQRLRPLVRAVNSEFPISYNKHIAMCMKIMHNNLFDINFFLEGKK